ncbi:MAG: hypothetical protein DCC75_02175 [Proteobacteria bacterium]|nr:MAG: hypothetical protein DCC75_02175 [Pseudomonadota bacterium]
MMHHPATLAVVFVAQFIFFSWLSLHRFVAGDEGYYLMAAKLAASGQHPYLDYFYPQMPLLPYLYGIWAKLFGFGWETFRLLSALMAALLGTALFAHIRHRSGAAIALLALALFLSSTLIFPWMPLVKTYALTTLLLFLAYLSFSYAGSLEVPRAKRLILLSGFLFGMATNTRLFFGPIGIVAALYIVFSKEHFRSKLSGLFCLAIGFAVALIPNLYFLWRDSDTYLFNNIGYHVMRDGRPSEVIYRLKLRIAALLVGIKSSNQHYGVQFGLLLICALILSAKRFLSQGKLDASLPLAVAVIVVSFLPTPPYLQYFSCAVPFLICGAILHLPHATVTSSGSRKLFIIGTIIFLAAYLWRVPHFLATYLESGKGVPWVKNTPHLEGKKPSGIQAVARKIDTAASPGEKVLALWPGYLVTSHAEPLHGLENHFGIKAAGKLPKDRRERYGILSHSQICSLLRRKQVRIAVIEQSALRKGCLKQALSDSEYHLYSSENEIGIYTLPNS